MTRWLLFLHIAGFAFWIGGSFAMMMVSMVARREERGALRTIARIQAAIARTVVGPGAGVTVVTGLILTFRMYGSGAAAPTVWLMVMQGAGLLGGILVFVLTLPTVARLARLARLDPQSDHAPYFDSLRRRARLVGMISSALALLALVGGTMVR